MKPLAEYISNHGIDAGCRMVHRAELLEGYFGDDLPKGFEQDFRKDWILEALTTHDKDKLQKVLRDKLGITDICDYNNKKNGTFQINYGYDNEQELEELKHIVEFFGWYITKQMGYDFVISPSFAKNENDYIYHKCYGWVYHICKTEDFKSILKNGLRCKMGRTPNDAYREFPQRIHVIAAPPKEVRNAIKDCLNEMEYDESDIKKLSVVKIDAKGDFYSDDAMWNKHAFFTYTNIPAKNITNSWSLEYFFDNQEV